MASMHGVPFEARERVRIGFLGCGGRGRSLMADFLAVDDVEITHVYDPWDESLEKATKLISEKGGNATVSGSDAALVQEDLDLVIVASPWEHHVRQAVLAMEAGKHVGVEVPCATTLEDCWKMVKTSEATRRHCIILENCCYGESEMTVLNMVEAGLFGELTYGEAAYIHDLRSILFDESGEGAWRRKPHTDRDGNLYPTHGLGPVARYLGVGEDDRFVSLYSMSTREASLSAYRDQVGQHTTETYRCGDMNTSLLKTAKGRVVLLQHDVVTPRPYDRLNMIQGTKGAFKDYPPRIFLDGQEGHNWVDLGEQGETYRHDLWRRVGELAKAKGGHGGMDFLMAYRLVETMKKGEAPDMDVYDAAEWSAPGPLSDESVATGQAVEFPNFRG